MAPHRHLAIKWRIASVLFDLWYYVEYNLLYKYKEAEFIYIIYLLLGFLFAKDVGQSIRCGAPHPMRAPLPASSRVGARLSMPLLPRF